MKKILLLALGITIAVSAAQAQSKTFQTVRHKFINESDVHSFGTSGFIARTILWMAGEGEFRDAITDIDHIQLITIPRAAFRAKGVTVNGLRKLVEKDSFEPLVTIRDSGGDVAIYMREGKSAKNNLYFMVVESEEDVVAIEIEGFIDIEKLSRNSDLSLKSTDES